MRVGIYTNLHKDAGLTVTGSLLSALEKRGVSCVLCSDLKGKLCGDGFFDVSARLDLDFMLSVGGDGTILRVAKCCAVSGIPILGVDLGFTGFLAEEEPDRTDELVDALIAGRYKIEKRMLLEAAAPKLTYLALNDAVVSRSPGTRMLRAKVFVNGEFVDEYHCDGYIVSTPTGSTAYSLSAGGPIVSPNVSALVLTSINSHSLHSRPIVVSDSDEVSMKFVGGDAVDLVIDGSVVAHLPSDTAIEFRKSAFSASFVRLSGNGFFKKLLTKLNKWSTTGKED